MQAKLFKCTMIDLKSKRVPAPQDSTTGKQWTNHPHACPCECLFCTTNTHRYSPSSWNDEVRATRIHQVLHQQYTEKSFFLIKPLITTYYLDESIQECSMCCIFGEITQRAKRHMYKASSLLFFPLKNRLKKKSFSLSWPSITLNTLVGVCTIVHRFTFWSIHHRNKLCKKVNIGKESETRKSWSHLIWACSSYLYSMLVCCNSH